MKARFDRAVRLFGEDGSQLQPDEFFGIFDAFLTALAEAQHDNDACKRKREEDERRAKQDAEVIIIKHFNMSFCTPNTID